MAWSDFRQVRRTEPVMDKTCHLRNAHVHLTVADQIQPNATQWNKIPCSAKLRRRRLFRLSRLPVSYDLCSLVGLLLPRNLHLSCLECVNAIDKALDAKCCAQISPPSSVTMHTTPESESDEEAEPYLKLMLVGMITFSLCCEPSLTVFGACLNNHSSLLLRWPEWA